MQKTNDCYTTKFVGSLTQRWLSDLHLDSPYTDLKKVKKLFDEAKEKGYQIIVLGDLFDVMGKKFDPRTLKGDIRQEHNVDNYINVVVNDVAEFLSPYIDCIGLVMAGNHEKEHDRRAELYLLELLSWRIHNLTGKYLNWTPNYAGFMRVSGNRVKKHVDSNRTYSKTIFYNHGKDGNAQMSLGALQVKRNASIIDADIFISGHIHRNLLAPLNRVVLDHNNQLKVVEQLHIQLGTAKETTSTDYFSARKGFDPASTSFYDIDFQIKRSVKGNKDVTWIEFIERRIRL